MALACRSKNASGPTFLFSVGKKKFKKAVDRNRIRRLMKEAVRLQYGFSENQIALKELESVVWIYTGQDIPDFDQVRHSIKKLFHEFAKRSK